MVTSMSISMRSTMRSMSISMRSITTKSTNTKSIMKSTNTKSITKRSMHHLHLRLSTRSMRNPRVPHLLQSQHLLHNQPLLSQALLPQIPRTGNSHKYTIK